jgi:hypothetical protein
MKLLVPPLHIEEGEGFSVEKDIFLRKEFGIRLSNMLRNSDNGIVVGLDARWGEGKTTFAKMWKGHLESEDKGFKCAYYDAFSSDYQKDPFLSITSKIYSLLKDADQEIRDEFAEKASRAIGVLGRVGLRIAIKAATGNILDETILDGVSSDVGDGFAVATNKLLEKQITEAEAETKKVEDFKLFLSTLTEKVEPSKPIVIIVDELDRCRPDFALQIIESIKHFFSFTGIHFVLVMNKHTIEKSIVHLYGDIGANTYLQKFVNVWASLPSKRSYQDKHTDRTLYTQNCLERMGCEIQIGNNTILKELVNHYQLTLREIEHSLTNFAIIYNTGISTHSYGTTILSPFISIIKVKFPAAYSSLKISQLTSASSAVDHNQVIDQADIRTLSYSNWSKGNYIENHPIKLCLRLCLTKEINYIEEELGKKRFNIELYGSELALADILTTLEDFTV